MSRKIDIELAEEISARAEKRLVKSYKKALEDIRAEIARIYAAYSTDGVLKWSEMIKTDGNLLRRYESMYANIMDILKKNYKPVYDEIMKTYEDTYNEGYYKRSYDVQSQLGKELSFSTPNVNAIKQAIMNPISGLTLKEIAAKDRARVLEKVNSEITRGLIRGASINDMDKAVKVALGEATNNSQRIVRTEALRAFSLGQLESENKAKELGVKFVKRWSSSLDPRTRPSHRMMNGEVADENGMFTLNYGDNEGAQAEEPRMFGIAAEDIQCRCVSITQVEGFEDKKSLQQLAEFPYQDYEEYRAALAK